MQSKMSQDDELRSRMFASLDWLMADSPLVSVTLLQWMGWSRHQPPHQNDSNSAPARIPSQDLSEMHF